MARAALALIDRLAAHTPTAILAPLVQARQVVVHAMQDGIPYAFLVRGARPGWWVIRPTSSSSAQIAGRPAAMLLVMNFLAMLPRSCQFIVIVLFRLRGDTWACVPWNNSDAGQRGWRFGAPRQLHLVRHSLRPFDIAETAEIGSDLIYAGRRVNGQWMTMAHNLRQSLADAEIPVVTGLTPEIAAAWGILREHLERQREAEVVAQERGRSRSVVAWLERYLQFMGAELSAWHEAGDGYEVSWIYQGQPYGPVRLMESGFTSSAGICLNGTDHRHNLSAMVAVLREHRRLGRTV